MPMSAGEIKATAMEALLEWMFYKIVSTSTSPQAVIDDFAAHMKQQEDTLRQGAKRRLIEGDYDTYANASSGADAIKDLAETLCSSLTVSQKST